MNGKHKVCFGAPKMSVMIENLHVVSGKFSDLMHVEAGGEEGAD